MTPAAYQRRWSHVLAKLAQGQRLIREAQAEVKVLIKERPEPRPKPLALPAASEFARVGEQE